MGLFSFGKKQPSDKPAQTAAEAAASDVFVAQPDKAARFFDHAKTSFQTGNFEYALMLFAKGLRFDPHNTAKHDDAWKVAAALKKSGGKPATKENLKELEGPSPVDKFVQAEYIWWRDPLNIDSMLRMMDLAAKAGMIDFATLMAPRFLDILRAQGKQTKAMWLKAKASFAALDCWDQALTSLKEAQQLDPTDTALSDQLREVTARHALKQGGYDKAPGTDGGLRSNIKDAAKQQALQDAGAIAASEESEARNLERARKDYSDNPMSADAVQKLGTLLRRKATAEAEEEAYSIFMQGFERLNEYRFKMLAGEIRIMQLRRVRDTAQRQLEKNPEDATAKAEFDRIRLEFLALEGRELREKQRNYPTDRSIKAELGRVEFELGNYEDAMAAFQSCKDEAKLRIMATHMLGRCFAASGWHGEAIGEYREALQSLGAGEADRELPVKYDLMCSLMELARAEKNANHAREAGDICSAIVRRDISYRDIRAKRKEIDTLLKETPG
ncbi:MAG: hypothetical protein QM516_09515 [Limnohabitans sp.]|nr:hypothetical protein [Limnohabitans sp.]